MGKLLVMPNTINQIKTLECDGIIIGIDGLSVNMPAYFKIEDLKKIKNKEIFVCLNKNMHNQDIETLQKTLLTLQEYPIEGVFFYDIAVVNLSKKLNLSYPLIWAQEHMTNNYFTVNFWKQQGVNGSHISSDITVREMQEIRKNTDATLFVNVFGYIPLFTSKRHLIQNYFNTFHLQSTRSIHYMEKEGKSYPVIDNKEGTSVYSDFIVNGLRESLLLSYDYYIMNSFQIEAKSFQKAVSIFKSVTEDNLQSKEEELSSLFQNLQKGFFYEETVYKVK